MMMELILDTARRVSYTQRLQWPQQPQLLLGPWDVPGCGICGMDYTTASTGSRAEHVAVVQGAEGVSHLGKAAIPPWKEQRALSLAWRGEIPPRQPEPGT